MRRKGQRRAEPRPVGRWDRAGGTAGWAPSPWCVAFWATDPAGPGARAGLRPLPCSPSSGVASWLVLSGLTPLTRVAHLQARMRELLAGSLVVLALLAGACRGERASPVSSGDLVFEVDRLDS